MCVWASQGTASPGKILWNQRVLMRTRAGPLPGTQLGENRGGPFKPSLLKSGCYIYFPLLAARRGSPSQPLIVVSAS